MIPVLAMQGAIVRVPLTGTDMLVEVTDPNLAEPCLTRLLGPGTAVEVLTGREQVERHPVIARLALVLWARRWWPTSRVLGIAPLSPDLLALEAAGLSAELDTDLDDSEGSATDWFDLVGDGAWGGAGPVLQLLAGHFEDLDDARADRAAILAAAAPAEPDRRDFALAAGGERPRTPSGAIVSGTASIDWARVPPGVLDAAEGTVTWSLVPAGLGVAVRVEVAALASVPLVATVRGGGAQVVLDLEGEAPLVAGEREVPDGVAAAILAGPVEVVVGSAGAEPGAWATTPAARAEVVAWVRARAELPGQELLLAERGARW